MAPVVNARGPLFVHPEGVVKRTTFHVMSMYANLLEANVAEAWVAGDPFERDGRSVQALDAVATCDADMKRWRLALINRHAEQELACTVVTPGAPLSGSYKSTALVGDAPDAFNDIEHPARVAPVETQLHFNDGATSLPPHSVTIVSIG